MQITHVEHNYLDETRKRSFPPPSHPVPSSKYSQFPFSFLVRDGKEQPLERYTFVSKLWTSGKSDGKKEKANSGAVKFRDSRNPSWRQPRSGLRVVERKFARAESNKASKASPGINGGRSFALTRPTFSPLFLRRGYTRGGLEFPDSRMSGCSELCARFTFRFSYPSHNIIPSSTSSPPLDTIPSQASLPPETSKTSSTYPRAVHWLRADFQISRTIAVSVQNTFGIRRCIKVCGRGGVVFTRRGGSAITILHSTGIGRDVARLNSKLPRKLPLFPASQLRPTVLFHARFIDPRTILPRPPTQTRFRPVALSYAVMVSTVSLLLSPLSFFPRSENSKLFASVRRSSCRVRACLSGNGKG